MADIFSHFTTARNYIRWSREALDEFEAAARYFARHENFACVSEVDSQSGETFIKYRSKITLPDTLGRKGTEAINNTRHAFDSIVAGAHAAIGFRSPRDDYFPWANNPSDFEGRVTAVDKKTKVSIYAHELWPTLRRLQPYPRGEGYSGGDDIVRDLAKISNRKHSIGFTFAVNIPMLRYPDITAHRVTSLSLPVPRWDGVKNEVVVARYCGEAQVHNYGHIEFFIAIDETGPIKSVPAIAALRHFSKYADTVRKTVESGVSAIINARST